MVEHIGQRIKEVVDNKGFSVKDLSIKTGKSTTAIYEIFKKKDVSSEILREFADILGEPVATLIGEEKSLKDTDSSQTATGTGNIAGDSNKQKVEIGRRLSSRQEIYGMGIDEIYIKLLTCEKEREVLRTELTGVKNLLASKDEMIQMLRQK